MIEKVFRIEEDFEPIIEQTLKNRFDGVKTINLCLIPTGWTNIVYEAETNKGNYFFRFPRDEFWKRTIVKDYEFAKYINKKTSFKTVELNLYEDKKREFSVHRKIEGTPLAEKMDTMSKEDILKVTRQISKFMYELHNVKFDKSDIFKVNNIGTNLNDFIQELLDIHVSDNDKEFWKNNNFKINDQNYCLVHGDLNSSNILLDEKNNISAIIDFGFAGLGNKYFDIARIIGRCPENFKDEIIKSYETLEKRKLNMDYLDKNIDIWKRIDQGYINYMKKNN